MTQITKDMTIAQLLSIDSGCAKVLMEAGMHCIGCPASAGESLEQAGTVHGIDVDELVSNLNDYFQNK